MGFGAKPGWRRSIRQRWRESARRWSGRCRRRTASAPRVLIGRDTRESGEWIEARARARAERARARTLVSVGVIPTPGVAFLTRSDGFDAGIVISASHNPYEDNGIKIFSGRGEKLDEALRGAHRAPGGRQSAGRCRNAGVAAIEPELRDGTTSRTCCEILPMPGPLAGQPHGRSTAPTARPPRRAGAVRAAGLRRRDVIGNQPNGRNINLHCGSTHLDAAAARGRRARRAARRGVRRRRRSRAVRRSPRQDRGRRRRAAASPPTTCSKTDGCRARPSSRR